MTKNLSGTLWSLHFPRTFELLDEQAESYIQAYLREMDLSAEHNLKDEDLRYFAGFVRQKSGHKLISEVARWEGALCLLKTLELEFVVRGDEGTVFLAPSLQTFPLTVGAEVLNKKPGLYGIIKQGSQVCDQLLGPFEALLIDLVQEDRKFTPEQLLQMAEFEGRELPQEIRELSKTQREEKLKQLFQVGILQVVRTKELI